MTDILFIHGSWHGGWAWDGIVPALAEKGNRILAPCLKGLGSDAAHLHRDIGMFDHVDQLERLVQAEDLRDVLLVGHSYGGALAHCLEGRIADRLLAVVHLEGSIPPPGSAIMDTWPADRLQATLADIAENGEGWRVSPFDPRDWGALSDEQVAWLAPRLTPQSLKTYQDPMPADLQMADCPHYYLYASDRIPQPFGFVIDQFIALPNWQFAATTGGHELMLTNPDAVLRVIEMALAGGNLPTEI